MKTQTSFWALFGENSSGENLSIEIPKIQRDYGKVEQTHKPYEMDF